MSMMKSIYSRLINRAFTASLKPIKAAVIILLLCQWAYSFSVFAQEEKKAENSTDKNTTSSSWPTVKNMLDNLQIQGFASQAFISTSANDVFGNTDNGGNFGFTEIGINALIRPLPRLQLSGQMLSRRAGKDNTGTPRLDFAVLDYRIFSEGTNQFGIRFGRLKNPLGFYNDTRDVAFTRPSILLPQSIYFDRTRNLGLSADSVQFYGETTLSDWGDLSFQFGITRPIVNDRDTTASLIRNQIGKLTPDISLIGRGMYESTDKRLRLAISGVWLNVDYKPGINDTLGPGSLQFSPIYVSAQYNTERWSLTSEYATRHFRFKNFNDTRFDSLNFVGESFYFQGEYRLNHKWEALIRYDVLFTDRNDRDGSKFAALTNNTVPAHTRFAKDLTVGLRWNITPRIMARFEYHRISGTAWLSPLDNPNSLATSKNWSLYAAQLSFRF